MVGLAAAMLPAVTVWVGHLSGVVVALPWWLASVHISIYGSFFLVSSFIVCWLPVGTRQQPESVCVMPGHLLCCRVLASCCTKHVGPAATGAARVQHYAH